MGSKASREDQHHHHHHSSSNNENYYRNNFRAYPTWNHGVVLTSNNASHFTAQEMQNFCKHNRTTSSSNSQISNQQEKGMTISSSNNYIEIKKPRFDQNTPKPKLGIRKSQSANNLLDTTNIVTAQQLFYDQTKRRQKHRSPSFRISSGSSQISNVTKSESSTSITQSSTSKNKRKKIPDNFTFVSINPSELQVNYPLGLCDL